MRLGEEITISDRRFVVSSIWQTLGEEPDTCVLTRIPDHGTVTDALRTARRLTLPALERGDGH